MTVVCAAALSPMPMDGANYTFVSATLVVFIYLSLSLELEVCCCFVQKQVEAPENVQNAHVIIHFQNCKHTSPPEINHYYTHDGYSAAATTTTTAAFAA
jgi:hypothetical protein